MQSISISHYQNYQVGKFDNLDFTKYYDGTEVWLKRPEALTVYLNTVLPPHISTVVIFGCASGRDFLPFQSKYKCVGFDIAPVETINWVCDSENLTYVECSIEDFIKNIEQFEIDWKNTLVYSHGTLMYVEHSVQDMFVQTLLTVGCKNIVLQEYEPGKSGRHPFLNLNQRNLSLFSKQWFRPNTDGQPIAHIMLEESV